MFPEFDLIESFTFFECLWQFKGINQVHHLFHPQPHHSIFQIPGLILTCTKKGAVCQGDQLP